MDIVEVPFRPTLTIFVGESFRRPQEYRLLVVNHLLVPGSYVDELGAIKGRLELWGDSAGASWREWTVSTTETRYSTDLPMGRILVVRIEEGLDSGRNVLVDVSVRAEGRWRKGRGPIAELESKVAEVSAALEPT
jgi:hypothetical protein